jgi:AcrR family transcriptional regulator
MAERREDRAAELRSRIVAAALQVVREHGMARARTSAIAEAAGCAEGSIYRYFSGKPQLIEEAVRTRLSDATGLPSTLPARAGTATVRANLRELSRGLSARYADVVPLAAGVLADSDLRAVRRRLFEGAGLGSREAAALAAYLRAEQGLGRIRAEADVDAAARLLVAGWLGTSLLSALGGRHANGEQVVETVLAGLEPGGRGGDGETGGSSP